jgi:hypothetical protein
VSGFDQLVAHVERALAEIRRVADHLIATCGTWLGLLGPLADALRRDLAELAAQVQRVLDTVGEMIRDPGDPVGLWRAGEAWTGQVSPHAGNLVGTLTAAYLRADDAWKGPAATAYLDTLPAQKDAAAALHEVTGRIGVTLQETAMTIAGFWIGLLAGALGLLAQLVMAAAGAATGVGAPPAAAVALAATARFLAVVAALTVATVAVLREISANQTTLGLALADNAAFPGPPAGAWPVSTTDRLSDGSMTDGDGSDWQLSY